jgi:hypothetical protein
MSLGGGFAGFGHDAWLIGHLGWDPSADPEALLRDYYDGLFGEEAGLLVRRYHQRIEEGQAALALRLSDRLPAVSFTEALELYRPFQQEATALLDQARTKVHNDRQRQRLEILRAGWDYVRFTLDGLAAVQALDARPDARPTSSNFTAGSAPEPHPDPQASATGDAPDTRPGPSDRALAEKALKAIDARAALVAAWKGRDPEHLVMVAENVERYDRSECSPLAPSRARYILEDHRFEAQAVRIDAGLPSPAHWDRAPPFGPFLHHCTGEPVEVQTEARAVYNQRALFLRVEAREPNPAALEGDQLRLRDSAVWMENDLEVLLDPLNTRRDFYHLITNSLGTPFDMRRGDVTAADWSADWKVAVTRRPDAWTAEFEIPFSALGVPPPQPGGSWRLNIGRLRRAPLNEYSAWAPPYGGFGDARRFGRLVFQR